MAGLQAPMDLSLGFTKGFHNAPKLWGDDTVRPQQQVIDFKSGIKAVGREFGFGWYDGITGLFTQPWKGAQKQGTSGFLKGIGKGVGGFATKPSAALFGIPGHFMKGVQKEVHKAFRGNVQNYIVASRTAQGYEEWLQSSDAEKEDVIVRWRLIQKYLKKKRNPDEVVRDVIEARRQMKKNAGFEAMSAVSTDTDSLNLDAHSAVLGRASQSSEESLRAAEIHEIIQQSVLETLAADAGENTDVTRASQGSESRLEDQPSKVGDQQVEQDHLRQAIAASEAEVQRHVNEALEYEKPLKRVMAQTLREQGQ